jgi:ribosomal protein S12 methylthiotransferase accessory factor
VDTRGGGGGFVISSNGLASGNHLLEAISHAICEVVERDATTLWHLSSAAAQATMYVDLATVTDADCCAVLEKYRRAGVRVEVWEITSDVGIPTFACRIEEQTVDPLHIIPAAGGVGCHPTRAIALLRALLEAAQSRLTMIAGSRDDRLHSDYQQFRAATREQTPPPVAASAGRNFADGPNWEAATFDTDILWELERLRAVGIAQVVVVDLTNPAFGLPVARVVIPGLERLSDSPTYTPGARARARVMESL